MTLTLDEPALRSIARGGATLYERAESEPGRRDSPLNRSRLWGGSLERWKDLSALGDEEGFGRRLSWEGWSPDVARSLLRRSSGPGGDSLPDWAKELDSIMEEADRVCSEFSPRWFLRREPDFLNRDRVAFEELLAPFVMVATRRLDARLESERDRLSPGAFAELQRELLKFCSLYGARVLYRAFSRFREQQGGSHRTPWQSRDPEPRRVYRRFVRSMLRGAFPDLLRSYPVLGRNLAVSIGAWVDWIEEFLIRLDRDWPRLVRSFAGVAEPGRVVDVLADQSDRHCGGRSIIICRFESGRKFVYKPRSIEADARFYDLLEWLNDRSDLPDFKRPRTVERSGYGWREYVPATACDGPQAAGRFYRRTGVLLFLMYLLQGDDAHCENLVASGEYPLLVDLESILSPPIDTPPESRNSPARMRARAHLKETVLRTGFLPRQFPHPEGEAYDATGLGGRNGEVTDHVRPSWVRVNTDSMEMQTSYHVIEGLENLPAGPDGDLFEPRDHLQDLVEGFESTYQFFVDQRPRILEDETHPLMKMKCLSGRYLPRGTTEYSRLIFSGSSPEYMRDGARRSLLYDALARSLLWSNRFLDEPDLLPLEHRAMDRLDIPLFYAPAAGTELRAAGTNGNGHKHPGPGDSIEDFFEQSGFERMKQCLRGLNEEDRAYQVSIIRTGFFARRRSHRPRPVRVRDPSPDPQSPADRTVDSVDFQDAARQVGRWILERTRMIRGERDRTASWIAVEPEMRHEDYELQPLGFSFFSGTSGIALFLGRLARSTGEDAFFRAAEQAMGEVDSFPRRRLRRRCEYRPAGGIAGVVSAAYPLALMGEEWQRPEWIDRARWIAERIPEPSLSGDSASVDIMTGMAGTVLVLSAVLRRAPSPEIKQRLETLGEALIERTASGTRVVEQNRGAQGFSRGRAGIATALFRLARVTGKDRFRVAAEASLNVVQNALDRRLDTIDHPARRGQRSRPVHLSWCQGLAGKMLPFLEARSPGPEGTYTEVLHRMADLVTVAPGETEDGTLCCGVAGRALVLAEMGSSMDHAPYRVKARSLAARMAARERKGNEYDGIAEPPGTLPNPGLFQGWAGLGMLCLDGIEGGDDVGGILRCL